MQTLDIPQANDLDTVRRVLHAIARGARTPEAIADFTGYSHRHTQYRVHAARVLGLVHLEGDETLLTIPGERLLDTPKGTLAERELYTRAINQAAVIQLVAPDLLAAHPPTIEELTDRLFHQSKLAPETARRRAGGLLAWRRYVLGETLDHPPRHPAQRPPPRSLPPASPQATPRASSWPTPSPVPSPSPSVLSLPLNAPAPAPAPAATATPAPAPEPVPGPTAIPAPAPTPAAKPTLGPTSKAQQLSLL